MDKAFPEFRAGQMPVLQDLRWLSDLPVPTAGMVTQYTSAQFKWQQAGITFRHSNGLVELKVCLYFIESLLKVSRDIWGVLSMYIFVIVFSDTLVTSTLHR